METLKQKDKKFYITLGITLAIMLGFGFLPPVGQITPAGMRVLGVFLGCIFAWCCGEIIWSSILGLVLASAFGYGTYNANFASAFGNATTATLICGMVFCFAVQSCGLLKELARWIISLKIVQKSKYSLLLGFYIAAIILGMLVTNAVPPIILLWALFYEIAKESGIKPYSSFTTLVLCGVGVCACAGVVMMPYGAMAVLVQGIAKSFDPTFSFNTIVYIVSNFLVNLLFIPMIAVVLKFIIRPKFDFELVERETYKMNITKEIKIVLVVFLLLLVALIVPNIMPKTSFVYQLFVGKIGTAGLLSAAAVALAVIRVNGKALLDMEKGIKEGVAWSLVILMSSAIAISNYLTAEGMGIMPTIIGLINPLVEGRSAVAITVIFIVLGVVITNLINDVVTATVLYPIAATFILGAGGSIDLFAALFVAATIQGCLMPSGSMVGAMFHGNSEWMKPKDVIFWVIILEIVLCIAMALVTWAGASMGF